MKVVATYSIKGGVGKTSAAVNLGALAARNGVRTLLWDLDPQGAASYLFRVKPRVKGGGEALVTGRTDVLDRVKGTDVEGLDLLPADFSYRNLDLVLHDAKRPVRRLRPVLRPLVGEFDLVIVDCAPSISLVSEGVFEAADALLVPLIPSTLSLRTLAQLRDFLAGSDGHRPRVAPFFSMVDARKKLHRSVIEEAEAGVLTATIPAATEVELMGVRRSPVVVSAPRSRAALAYEALWDEAARVLALPGGG
ncbi:MAG TPA: ParA family protein [Acidimicrobiales bacterium]|nr:ParA family protein [Acidimicrobiales bacterium]